MRGALALTLTAVTLAGCGQGGQRSSAAPPGPAGAAPGDAARLFAVLRSPRAPGDALPRGAERAIRRHPEGGDPAGARRAGPSLWVVPGKRAVCLVYARRFVSAGCAPLSVAARGLARNSLAGSGYRVPAGRRLVYGIVPDGVRAVEVDLADTAAVRTVPVRRNVWRTVLDDRARGWLRAGAERMPLP